MTEQELQAIDDLLAKLPGKGEWWAEGVRPYGVNWEVRYTTGDEGEYDAIGTMYRQEAEYVAQLPASCRQLYAEVQFLRGQLADLCEDSRAVAEVGRLRLIIQAIRAQVEDYQDTMESYSPKWMGVAAAMARLREMASVEGGNP